MQSWTGLIFQKYALSRTNNCVCYYIKIYQERQCPFSINIISNFIIVTCFNIAQKICIFASKERELPNQNISIMLKNHSKQRCFLSIVIISNTSGNKERKLIKLEKKTSPTKQHYNERNAFGIRTQKQSSLFSMLTYKKLFWGLRAQWGTNDCKMRNG